MSDKKSNVKELKAKEEKKEIKKYLTKEERDKLLQFNEYAQNFQLAQKIKEHEIEICNLKIEVQTEKRTKIALVKNQEMEKFSEAQNEQVKYIDELKIKYDFKGNRFGWHPETGEIKE